MTPTGQVFRILAYPVFIIAVIVSIYYIGRGVGTHEINTATSRVVQYQGENQKLVAERAKQTATLTELQVKLKEVQARLEMITPSENTYDVSPNQSLIVADGHLTVGLVGTPKNEGVDINVNGKQQSVVAGDVITVALDPSTNCQVKIQSFDMFKATFTATCTAAKPQ